MSLADKDKRWITTQLEGVKTALSTQFHKWSSPVDMRVKSHSAALRAIDVELESVADRVTKLEGENGKREAR